MCPTKPECIQYKNIYSLKLIECLVWQGLGIRDIPEATHPESVNHRSAMWYLKRHELLT